jgi:pimeloyl-ACP methyl ester carboxylesterase
MGLRARGLAWEPVVEHLEQDHQLAFFDHRGIGPSAPLEGPTSMAEMAGDAAGVMDHLGWDAAHAVGVSMGGMAAQHLALDHGPRLRSLSLICTSARGGAVRLPAPSTVWIYLQTWMGSERQRFTALSRLLYSPEFLAQPGALDQVVGRLGRAFGHDAPGTWRAQFSAIGRHDVRDRLEQMPDVPTLVIGAGCDRLVPIANSEYLHERLPGSRMQRFDGAGHGVLAERAGEVAASLRAHIAAASRAVAK